MLNFNKDKNVLGHSSKLLASKSKFDKNIYTYIIPDSAFSIASGWTLTKINESSRIYAVVGNSLPDSG